MRLFLLLLILLPGCHENKPVPVKAIYQNGDMAKYERTGECVRIVAAWRSLSTNQFSGSYTVRFNDGAEIEVNQPALSECK